MASMSVGVTVRSSFLDLTSKNAMALLPSLKTTNASFWPSGDQVPAELMKRRASKCASVFELTSLSTIFPVRASTRKRSSVNTSFCEMTAMYFPSGPIDGDMLNACLPAISFLPISSGLVRPSSWGLYSSITACRH